MRIALRYTGNRGLRLAVSLLLAGGMAGSAATTAWAAHPPCSAPEYRAFDFWVGDWDAYNYNQIGKVAQVRVERALNGCVVHEFYEDDANLRGESFSIYDRARKVWHQTWVTSTGTLLTIEGGMRGGAMVLIGVEHLAGGKVKQVRGVWMPIRQGVRETGTISLDGGKTWKPWFDLVFRPHVN